MEPRRQPEEESEEEAEPITAIIANGGEQQNPHSGLPLSYHNEATVIYLAPVDTPPPGPTRRWWGQNAAILFRVALAACNANYSWPRLSPPLEDIVSFSMMPYLEFGAGIYYVVNTNPIEIRGRLRAEWRNDARFGAGALVGKIMLATLLPMAVGAGQGIILYYYNDPTNRYAVFFTSGSVSRIIAALASLVLYIVSWKFFINKIWRPNPFRYTQHAPLHYIQKILNFLVRVYDSVVIFKFFSTIYRDYGPNEHLHNMHFTLGAALADQIMRLIDLIGIGKELPNPFVRNDNPGVANFLPQIIRDDSQVRDTDPLQELVEVEPSETESEGSIINRYGEGRRLVYIGSHVIPEDNRQKLIYYSTGIVLSLGVASLTNFIASQIVNDKEVLSEPKYSLYLAVICAASAGSEILYQTLTPRVVSWVGEKLSRVYSSLRNWSFFAGSEAAEEPESSPQVEVVDERTPLASSNVQGANLG